MVQEQYLFGNWAVEENAGNRIVVVIKKEKQRCPNQNLLSPSKQSK